MFANFATAITSSTAVTLALFYVMNLLIAIQPGAVAQERQRDLIDWVPYEPPEDRLEKREPPPDKSFIEPPVPPSSTPPGEPHSGTGVATKHIPPPPVPQFRGIGVLGVDGPLVALIRPQPAYPVHAQSRGLEGYVIVEFDVQVDGSVANIRIVESSDSIFERSALKAAERFRFKPRVVDGVALESPGIRNLFRYRMESK